MHILGIESSCDDTSVALIEATKNGFVVLAEKTASQIDVHKKYGGVVPEIAGRKHAEKILPAVEEVLGEGGFATPDVIAVTSGPGLMTGLLVGTEVAKTLSYLWDVPIVRTNHIEGHIYSVKIQEKVNHEVREAALGQARDKKQEDFEFPALCLVVSGGHTELILMTDHGKYELVGRTRDDAAGECFDKVAKLIGLDYPGGPKISKHAEKGNPNEITFPRPMIKDGNFDFSFSGLKTAALYWLQDNQKQNLTSYTLSLKPLQNFCASFEQAIIDVLVTKTIKATKKYNPKTIILAGGVSANKKLKNTLKEQIQENFPASLTLYPKPKHAMDNATMIAIAGYHHAIKKDFTSWKELEADPQWKIYN